MVNLKSMMKLALGLFGTLVLCISCSMRPSNILPPEKMEQVLYDYHIAKGLADQNRYEERYRTSRYVENALSKNGVSIAQFDSSMLWYTRNMPELSKIYKKLTRRFEQQKVEIDSLVKYRFEREFKTEKGDSVDIWPLKRVFRMNGTALNSYVTFSIKRDDNFKKGDYYRFNLRTKYLFNQPDSVKRYHAVAGISLLMDNRESVIKNIPLIGDTIHSIDVFPDSLNRQTSKLQGFFYLPPQGAENILIIDSISLYRMHVEREDNDSEDEAIVNDSIKSDIKKIEPATLKLAD